MTTDHVSEITISQIELGTPAICAEIIRSGKNPATPEKSTARGSKTRTLYSNFLTIIVSMSGACRGHAVQQNSKPFLQTQAQFGIIVRLAIIAQRDIP